MPQQAVLVIGASRGIGAELVRQYLADGHAVHATVRNTDEPGELAGSEGGLILHRLDVREAEAIREGGVLAIMTSQLGARRGRTGSLGDYGDSKEALNDEVRRRADAWARPGVIAMVVHPGWVRTDMGGASAPLSVEESADGVRQLIGAATLEHHGRFWTWDGREHPW